MRVEAIARDASRDWGGETRMEGGTYIETIYHRLNGRNAALSAGSAAMGRDASIDRKVRIWGHIGDRVKSRYWVAIKHGYRPSTAEAVTLRPSRTHPIVNPKRWHIRVSVSGIGSALCCLFPKDMRYLFSCRAPIGNWSLLGYTLRIRVHSPQRRATGCSVESMQRINRMVILALKRANNWSSSVLGVPFAIHFAMLMGGYYRRDDCVWQYLYLYRYTKVKSVVAGSANYPASETHSTSISALIGRSFGIPLFMKAGLADVPRLQPSLMYLLPIIFFSLSKSLANN